MAIQLLSSKGIPMHKLPPNTNKCQLHSFKVNMSFISIADLSKKAKTCNQLFTMSFSISKNEGKAKAKESPHLLKIFFNL
jgi:hypothetical protein